MQFVQNLYFIGVVIAFAAVVVLLIVRSSSGRSRREARRSFRARKRRLERHRHRLSAHPSSQGGDPWRKKSIARAEGRKKRPADGRVTASHDLPFVPTGSFIAQKPETETIRDQDINPAEHLSIGEYLSQADRERAKEKAREEAALAAQGDDKLTMRAVKYELVDDADESGSGEDRKQASFKP